MPASSWTGCENSPSLFWDSRPPMLQLQLLAAFTQPCVICVKCCSSQILRANTGLSSSRVNEFFLYPTAAGSAPQSELVLHQASWLTMGKHSWAAASSPSVLTQPFFLNLSKMRVQLPMLSLSLETVWSRVEAANTEPGWTFKAK